MKDVDWPNVALVVALGFVLSFVVNGCRDFHLKKLEYDHQLKMATRQYTD